MTEHNTTNPPLIFSQVVDAIVGKQGGTFGPDAEKSTGYFYGGNRPTVTVAGGRELLRDPDKLVAVAELVKSAIERGSNAGVWVDEFGTVYVDDSAWTPSESRAIEQAQANRELEVWDVANERGIKVGRFTDSGDYVKLI